MDTQGSGPQLTLLSPDWQALASAMRGEWIDPLAALSAIIVLLVVVLLTGFLVHLFIGARKSFARVAFLQGLLTGVSPDQLVSARRDLTQKALSSREVGALWREFDETLVASVDENRLWNTVDADYFFNTHTLARGITESRLIGAVPGFLTALGVIGTFIGLQIGLAGINFGSLDQAQQQMQQIISGASVAFMTSVWGISASVYFNAIEKLVEQLLRTKIAKLQDTIDQLFPRLRSEQMLVRIEDHARESRNAMQGLAEKIGDRMQEAALQMAEQVQQGVTSGIESVLAPAIRDLVSASNDLSKRQAQGSEQVLSTLLDGFVEKLGGHASAQRELMGQAAQDVSSATSGLQAGMEQFLGHLSSQTDAMKAGQLRVLEKVRETVSEQTAGTENVLTLGAQLAERVESMADGLTRIGTEVNAASEAMRSSTSNLNELADKTGVATGQLSGVLEQTLRTTEAHMAESQKLTSRLNDSLQLIDKFDTSIDGSANNIQQLAKTVQDGLGLLRSNQEGFLDQQQKQVSSLTRELAELLRSYGESVTGQTEERMNQWNDQTREFVSSLTSAIHVLHDTVSEIEDKFSSVAAQHQ